MKLQVETNPFTGFKKRVLVFALLLSLAAFGQGSTGGGSGETRRHLFILSGQSNMTGGLAKGFTATVAEAFGQDNMTVAMSMKSGRGLRFWCSDYRYPDNHPPSEQEQTDNGSLYKPLIDAVKTAAGDKSFDTVIFIWMQGESDAGKGRSDVYAENFLKLLDRLKADLKRETIPVVIGRISDHDMKNPNWTNMRDVQVKLAENHADGAWIDTDDLNGGGAGAQGGELHYPKDEVEKLGARFAVKAISMIRQMPGPSGQNSKNHQQKEAK
jgi:Carbohydrate esterase, sialic acid-specific acetylesterase